MEGNETVNVRVEGEKVNVGEIDLEERAIFLLVGVDVKEEGTIVLHAET
jgi:hypothetical protein